MYAVGDGPTIRDEFGEVDPVEIPSDMALGLVIPHGADDESLPPSRVVMSADDGKVCSFDIMIHENHSCTGFNSCWRVAVVQSRVN